MEIYKFRIALLALKLRADFAFSVCHNCFLILILMAGGFVSCSRSQVGTPPISEAELVRISADRMIIEERAQLRGVDSTRLNAELDSMYGRYGVNSESVSKSLDAVRTDLDRWKEFQQGIVRRLEQIQTDSTTSPIP